MTAEVQSLSRSWSSPIAADATLFLALAIYARGWNRLRAVLADRFPFWRLAAFSAGVVSVWIAIGSPLAALDDASLTVHMAQHLLLTTIAPPLILLSAPELPLLRGLPQSPARAIVIPFLRLHWVKRFGRLISNPAVCWLAATLTLLAWHFPAVFELALRLDWLHKLEHTSFLAAGLLFWWPVVQPWPSIRRWPAWSIPLYLFAATLPCDALSGFLSFCDRVVYRSYLSAPGLFRLSPLEDQECAAALMWVSVTVILLIPAVLVTLRILSPRAARSPGEPVAARPKIIVEPLSESKPGVA